MSHRTVRPLTVCLMVIALVMSGCTSAATPSPTPAKPGAAATKAPEKPAAEATKPAAATKAPEAAKPAADAPKTAAEAPKLSGQLPRSVTLATSTPGTTLNAMGTALAKVATDGGQLQVIVQPFSGSPAYIPQMQSSGKPETAILNSVEAWQAFTGKATPKPLPEGVTIPTPYDKPWNKLRALLMGTDLTTSYLVRKDSKFQTLED
ncbi:MAG: hypothetical protein M1358_18745, partial [Chloroflexi bacterium]|nr:hypothetical protein [Chloroflexota bacterium]